MDLWQQLQAELAAMERAGLRRHPAVLESPAAARVTVAGRTLVNLCSNNYLGLANHPEVVAAAAEGVRRWGVGAGGSRLLSGGTTAHVGLEHALARWLNVEAAVVTATGWQANACALSALAGEGDLVLADKLDHASILDAARHCGATFRSYHHGDAQRLAALLERLRPSCRRCVIVTDGVFSMDGDLAPLTDLAALKQRYEAVLVVDEAHALGVLGEQGRGSAHLAGVAGQVDVIVGTLSKALGACGGFVAGRRVLIETIINRARPFIYTTAPPAAVCEAALAALRIIQREPARREILLANAHRLRETLAARKLDIGASVTPIIPIVLGQTTAALERAAKAFDAGFLAPAIRPPTVAPGLARLRVSVMATHDWVDLQRFAEVIAPG